jgi:hypothetical protein
MGGKPTPIGLTVTTTSDTVPPGDQPPTLTKTQIFFPNAAVANGRFLPSCTESILRGKGPAKCPKKSKIGKGRATGKVGTLVVDIDVTAFNGPKGKSVLLYILSKPTAPVAHRRRPVHDDGQGLDRAQGTQARLHRGLQVPEERQGPDARHLQLPRGAGRDRRHGHRLQPVATSATRA